MNEYESVCEMNSITPPSEELTEFSVTIHVGGLEVLELGNNCTKKVYITQFANDVCNVVRRYSLLGKGEKELDLPLLNKGSVVL